MAGKDGEQARRRNAGKVTSWLEKDVFPHIGKLPISTIRAKDVLDKVARRMEARGIHESVHRIVQICSQVFRYAVAIGLVERDVTVDLRGALVSVDKTNYAAITDPKQVGQLMRPIRAYEGHPTVRAALQLSPLVFVRPGELRAAEWSEMDLDAGEWRIPGPRMKMKVEHLVPLSRQAVRIRVPQHPRWRALHEREHRQRGATRHGLRQRSGRTHQD